MRNTSRLRDGVLVWLCLACPVAGQELPKFQWEQTETVDNTPTRFELRLGEGEWFWAGVPVVVDVSGTVKTYALALPANLTAGKHIAILRACNDAGCTESQALAFTIEEPQPEPEPEPQPVPDMAALLVRVAMLEAAVEKLSTLTQQQASAISQADLRLTMLERRLDTTLQYLAETRSGGNVQQLQLYLQRIPR